MVIAAVGLGSAGAGLLLWRAARGRVRTYWIVLAVFVGALTGMLGARLSSMPDTSRAQIVQQLAAVAVATCWFVVIRGAIRDTMRDKNSDDKNGGGRWHLD
jgi:hypothetical protein